MHKKIGRDGWELTWKHLWTHVVSGSLWLPFAWPLLGPFKFLFEEELWGGSLAALRSFSRMSTSSLSKKFRNSWASCKIQEYFSHGQLRWLRRRYMLRTIEYISKGIIIDLMNYLMHIAAEKLILFLQPLYKSLRSNNTRFLLLATDLCAHRNRTIIFCNVVTIPSSR
jgi:hypothetical protein